MAPQPAHLCIENCTVLTPEERLEQASVLVDNGRIVSLAQAGKQPAAEAQVVNAQGHTLVPGFIDLLAHGARGHDFHHTSLDGLGEMTRFFASTGVTSLLAGTTTDSAVEIQRAVSFLADAIDSGDFPQLLGIHCEGPFLSSERAGAHAQDLTRDASLAEIQQVGRLARGHLKMWTFAPDRDPQGPFFDWLVQNHGVASFGHSSLGYAEVRAWLAGKEQLSATHIFNAMTGIHHRRPGAVTALLQNPAVTLQLICDGIHVHASVIELLVDAVGPGRLALITDSNPVSGLADGVYEMTAGREVELRDGTIRLTSNGSLAGSVLTLDRALANMEHFTGLSRPEVLAMVTTTPARLLGLESRLGRIAPGCDANLVLIDENWQVLLTVVQGEIVHRQGI